MSSVNTFRLKNSNEQKLTSFKDTTAIHKKTDHLINPKRVKQMVCLHC